MTLVYSQNDIYIMKSENVGAMYLNIENSDYGREWMDSSDDHTNDAAEYTRVSMYLEEADSTLVYNGELTSIRGRGNTTWWSQDKKSYQIKLADKTDLLNSKDESNRNKTWILLANSLDKTLFRNALAFDLARYLGLDSTPEYRYVDLYFDGEYRGSYMITEKVQINSGRIEIEELEAHTLSMMKMPQSRM